MRQHPQPLPIAMQEPRRLVNVRDAGGARDLSNRCGVGGERCGDARDQLLARPLAQWAPEHGGPQVLPGTAARTNDAGPLTHAAWQPRALATALGGRDRRCAERATCEALPWRQTPVRHVGPHDWPRNNLMGGIRGQLHKLPRATSTARGKAR
jgi:hypothetical protein